MLNYKKGQTWNKAKTTQMKQFEKSTGKSAVFRGKITGQFEYWLWQQKTPSKTNIPKEFKEKFDSIKREYDSLNKLTKKGLVEIAQRESRLDISHIKSEDKYSIRNYILGSKFSNKSLEKFDKYNYSNYNVGSKF